MAFEKTYLSCAKINLGLQAPFRYPNGYHHIVSIFLPIDLCDEMHIRIKPSEEDDFSIRWANHLPRIFDSENTSRVFTTNFQDNLIFRANLWMKKFLKNHGVSLPNLITSVDIIKKIPSPGGLGGGSSNAATMLQAYMDFIKKDLAADFYSDLVRDLNAQCINIGSDIPFFLQNQVALISGVGEVFKIYPDIRICGILAIPSFGFSTSEMYNSMNRPSVNMEYDQILKILNSDSKKALQSDNLFLYNLQVIHEEFEQLRNGIKNNNPDELIRISDDNKKGKLLQREDSRTFLVNNNFTEVARKLFPDKYQILEGIRKISLEKLYKVTKGLSETIFLTSMSGSGATMYSGIVLHENPDKNLQQRLNEEVEALNKEYPDFYWVRFCSLK